MVFDANYHEDIIRATLDVVESVVKACEEDILDIIRKRVHKLKKSDYDVPMINFMKNFILAETENFYTIDSSKKSSGVKAFKKFIYMGGGNNDSDTVITKDHVEQINKDIEILWKLPAQKGIPENVKTQASKAIPEILSNERCSDKTKEKYIEMARKSLKSGDQVFNNLSFLKTLLINSQNRYGDIRKMNKNYNIAGTVILAAESYLQKAAKAFKDPYDFNDEKFIDRHLREKDPGLLSGHSHREHIEKMFEIIQYLIERADGQFPLENTEIEKLFQYFVSKRVSNIESEMLFDLICSVERSNRGYNSEEYVISDKKVRKFIFQTCLCKKDYVTPHDYSPKSIRCFKDLFLDINERDNKMILDNQNAIIKEVSSLDLDGMDTLWQIACQASNIIVQERAGYLLAIIHYLYMDKKDFNKWEKETDNIVKEVMDIIRSAQEDQFQTLNNAKLL